MEIGTADVGGFIIFISTQALDTAKFAFMRMRICPRTASGAVAFKDLSLTNKVPKSKEVKFLGS